jgi:naringenin degradation protein FdeC
MDITGLDSLVYGVEDVGECTRFYRDFGLDLVEANAAGSTFATLEKATIVLRPMNDPALPPAVTEGSQLRQVLWGVRNGAALEAIGAELSKDREVKRADDGTLWTVDPMGYGVGFRETRVTPIELAPTLMNQHGRPTRVNKRVEFAERARILKLGHVVIYCPNLEETYAFYSKRLGYRVSDSFEGGIGYFLRSAGSHEHHNLFLFHLEQQTGINHASFELRGFGDGAMAGEYLLKQGWKTMTGPGRHHIGSNYFWYFHSPSGGAVEYYADMDYLTDEWEPRRWQFRPDVVAAWDRGPGFIVEH